MQNNKLSTKSDVDLEGNSIVPLGLQGLVWVNLDRPQLPGQSLSLQIMGQGPSSSNVKWP